MIVVNDSLYVGSSFDERRSKVDAILNVAKDLLPTRDWGHGIEYVHIGLLDGPGNVIEWYYAAILSLSGLLKAGKRTLVCCHDGCSRSMAIVVMYLNISNGAGWDRILGLIREGSEECIPEPHPDHRKAFENINWRLLSKIINGI